MPKIKNLAALAAAVEAARRYARNNPDKAAKYLDQAAAFLDKQTKGKYSGQIRGVTGKVKSAAGLSGSARHGAVGNGVVQSFEANAGSGRHQTAATPANPGSTASAAPSTTAPLPPTPSVGDTGDPHFPGSKDV
jgi:hypothetical protein